MSATIKEGSDRTICNQDKQQPIMGHDEINDQVKLIEIDPASGALTTIEEPHHKVHTGFHFFYRDAVDLALNNVLDLQWTVADDADYLPHFTWELVCQSETEFFVYEGATINVAGTAVTPRNNNRNSSNTSQNTLATITNGSVANANADTAVAGALEITHGVVPAGNRQGMQAVRDDELILKQNTIYCLRAVALTAGWISFRLTWYEHPPHSAIYSV